jgi:hypothetical protein
MMEEGYKDLSELVQKEKYKELKSLDDHNIIIGDYLCLVAIRFMVMKKDKMLYKRSEKLLSILLEEETRSDIDFTEEICKVVKLFEAQKLELKLNEEHRTQNKYRENLFSKEDFLLYRGIAKFYLNEYQAAIKDFENSAIAKREVNNQLTEEAKQDQDNTYNSIDTDLSDIGLCAVNVNEQHFNIILCYVMVLHAYSK